MAAIKPAWFGTSSHHIADDNDDAAADDNDDAAADDTQGQWPTMAQYCSLTHSPP